MDRLGEHLGDDLLGHAHLVESASEVGQVLCLPSRWRRVRRVPGAGDGRAR
ncbi:hypothetical protein [Nonomuraea terrae]|uniref:hypothetical protein n=1 Tax=Nonomuraea terrae TaxID=2530383 RepID=UPI0014044A85|nr:hypothetical protein [Nonomuraea terrae]